MKEEKIVLRVAGESMSWEDGYDLNNVIDTLKDAQLLLNKTYLSLQGRVRYTANDDDLISLKIKKFEQGSLITELQIIYDSAVLPVLGTVAANPDMFWNVIKGSYEVIKTKLTAKKEGKEVNVTVDNNLNSQVIVPVINGDNNIVNITIPEYMEHVPDALQPEFDRMAKRASEKGLQSISLSPDNDQTVNDQTIKFDVSDHDKFEIGSVTTNDTFEITGKVIKANFNSLSGTIELTSSATSLLEEGVSYSFKIADNLYAEEVWREMFLSDKPYFCKVQYNTGNDKVEQIFITDWDTEKFNAAS